MANKVTHIVNCSGKEASSRWSSVGIAYFTLNWRDVDVQTIFSPKAQGIAKAIAFIDSALQKGNSVLVHSIRGQSRSGSVVLAYLMCKYHWSLDKALQFLRFRHPNIRIRGGFLKQLRDFEGELQKETKSAFSSSWTNPVITENDELVLRNTYMNSLRQSPPEGKQEVSCERKVKWVDEDAKESLVTVINPYGGSRAKSSKGSAFSKFAAKKFHNLNIAKKDPKTNFTTSAYLEDLENSDFTPAKRENCRKPQAFINTINFAEESSQKRFTTKLQPCNPSGQKKDLQFIAYLHSKQSTDVPCAINHRSKKEREDSLAQLIRGIVS